jgi:hypothetical protein
LLGFVHLYNSASPVLSPLILSFNVPTAAWRFNSQEDQRLMLARGSQHSSSISIQHPSLAWLRFKIPVSMFESKHSTET